MQADEGESLDVQQRTIAGYAQMHGLAVEHVFVERGVSGSKPFSDRPEGAKLLEALKPGGVLFTPSSTACSVPRSMRSTCLPR
jgi:DNA invertase Pin-like site-specific DNA recombinase